jgi:hypothetical protein
MMMMTTMKNCWKNPQGSQSSFSVKMHGQMVLFDSMLQWAHPQRMTMGWVLAMYARRTSQMTLLMHNNHVMKMPWKYGFYQWRLHYLAKL